jgi:hypothetical protein
LPCYAYELDDRSDPRARQEDLDGATAAWWTVGNDRIVANAFIDGHVEVWSQDRLPQWLNRSAQGTHQYGGGFGWVDVGGRIRSTHHGDLADDSTQERVFGTGYALKRTRCPQVTVTERSHAPFGDRPCIVHRVDLTNDTDEPLDLTWWEYWGVNPVVADADEVLKPIARQRRCDTAVVDSNGVVRFAQQQFDDDEDPLSVFVAPLHTLVHSLITDADAFFGTGTRATPAGPSAPRASGEPAGTAAIFSCRRRLAPHSCETLTFCFGAAHDDEITEHVVALDDDEASFGGTLTRWDQWLPMFSFDEEHRWLERELRWAAYQVRAATVYDEVAERHFITQGGYYQYAMGRQIAFRDPLMYLLPMCVGHPATAKDTLLYSMAMQNSSTGQTPFGRTGLGHDFFVGDIGDADFWLLLAVIHYVSTTRDFAFLDEAAPYSDGQRHSVWEHIRLAVTHQETFAEGKHGHYTVGPIGDWADFAPQFVGLTESSILTAHLAYAYPMLAVIADRRGEHDFGDWLRTRAEALMVRLRRDWVDRGWFMRGYAGDQPLGADAVYGDAQAWALIARAATHEQAATVLANVRRYLTGIDAPAAIRGPSLIGSSQSPAASDPDLVAEITPQTPAQVGDGNAVYFGGTWYAVNGWLTWGMAAQRADPGFAALAWDELKRNTLASHAEAFPQNWSGVLSVDDVCWSFYSSRPHACANGYVRDYNTQNTHQPTWLWLTAMRLAGLDPTPAALNVRPRIPLADYSFASGGVGLWRSGSAIGGFVDLPAGEALDVRVERDRGPQGAAIAVIDDQRVDVRYDDDTVIHVPTATTSRRRTWLLADHLDQLESFRGWLEGLSGPGGHTRHGSV